ncbi:GNAT family N-acetyltransferase [Paenibacillus eucommiae]|uniref:Ribosomal protein S18 acetylase RimI-like enzyme n=1 Tax=Paenibacillus eucommiae TaxID=1355755 RepID=A0ABS4J0R8_9BACL|nr:GNAT family N-acetyltransferase [Paenibacillus eucommiae]MBP1992354.1 ribosomal protein S18 acetylase RimI-like enzyme [Paenibacillus eucommiae]
MHVRSFQLGDTPSVTRLLQDVLSEPCYEDTITAFARQLSWDTELVLIAEEDEQIVGIIIGTIDNNNGYYYRIAVAKEHQRKGIGKAMIEGMKQRFLQRKVNKIMVTVDVHNEIMLPVYESAGYRQSDFSRAAHRLSIVKKISS